MMAMSKAMPEDGEPGELEALLPWHAAGTLNPRDAQRVGEALDRDPGLAKQYAAVLEEYAATIEFNESLGAPSSRAMHALFAQIDADPAQLPRKPPGIGGRIADFFAGLSPRALAWSASVAGFALLLQAGLIGAMLAWPVSGVQTASDQTQQKPQQPSPTAMAPAAAPQQTAEAARPDAPMVMAQRPGSPVVRSLAAPDAGFRALVRFAPDARASEIAALLDEYRAAVVDSGRGGLFRLHFTDHAASKQDQDRLIRRLKQEPIVASVTAAP